jgi:hypothetical protein
MKFTKLLVGLAAALAAHSGSAQIEFQRVDPSQDPFNVLRNRPDSESPEIIANLVRDRNRLPPPYLYELARRLWGTDKNGALEWYAVGMIRARYDALRCRDTTSHQGIGYLSMVAQNVAQGIDANRAAFGEAGKRAIARPDLFDSEVAPMWICIHGIVAINSAMQKKPYGPAEAYTPEAEWPPLQEKLRRDFATYFDEQAKPQDDPIAMTTEDFRRVVIPGSEGAWLDEHRLVFTDRKTLKLWSKKDGAVEELAQLNGFWCAGNGVVSWQTGREQLDKQLYRLDYVIGVPGKMTDSAVTLRVPLHTARMVQTSATSWSLQANAIRQSRFDCRWVQSARLSGEKNEVQWLALLPGHGFLRFSGGGGRYGQLTYLASEDAQPVDLPVPGSALMSLEAFHYFAYRGAYLISPVWGRRAAPPDEKCAKLWWLYPGGKTEEVCLPMDSVYQSNAVLFAPSKIGWLRLTQERNTPHGPKPGGAYLTRPDGRVEKILESRALSAAVSPDGCAVAIQHHDGSTGQKLEVFSLCKSENG